MTADGIARLEGLVAGLPEAGRVDVAEWGDHPTFRVAGKTFVFCDAAARDLTIKLAKEEGAAGVACDADVEPAGYGLGRHGWVRVRLEHPCPDDRWAQVAEWVEESYTRVA